MTLVELLEVAWCDAVEVIVREDGVGQWLYGYKIGKNVKVGKYDYYQNKDGELVQSGKFFHPEKAIEICRHDRHCRMLVIPKNISNLPKDLKHIPKEAQELQVHLFRATYIGEGIQHGLEVWCYPKGYVVPVQEIITKRTDERQFSLFDKEDDDESD